MTFLSLWNVPEKLSKFSTTTSALFESFMLDFPLPVVPFYIFQTCSLRLFQYFRSLQKAKKKGKSNNIYLKYVSYKLSLKQESLLWFHFINIWSHESTQIRARENKLCVFREVKWVVQIQTNLFKRNLFDINNLNLDRTNIQIGSNLNRIMIEPEFGMVLDKRSQILLLF